MGAMCEVIWGSHGCDLPANHDDEKHLCGSGFEEDDKDALPGEWTGPCSRLRVDEHGVGWVEHWTHEQGDLSAPGAWSEPQEWSWAELTPLEPPPPPPPQAKARAGLCIRGYVTTGLTTYRCTGSAHINGMEIVCTDPSHELPAPTMPLIVGAVLRIGGDNPLVLSSEGWVDPR